VADLLTQVVLHLVKVPFGLGVEKPIEIPRIQVELLGVWFVRLLILATVGFQALQSAFECLEKTTIV
jgi:hypothetical protein